MRKQATRLLSVIVTLVMLGLFGGVAQAETSVYSLHIVKYQVTAEANRLLPHDGTAMTTASDGLTPLAGISYTVTRMKLTNLGNYITADGQDSYSQTLTTDANGQIAIQDLPKGVYQVTELPNAQIQDVMKPVLVALPLVTATNSLNDVYIYPKSNLELPSITTPPGTPHYPDVPDTGKKLPNTSGEIAGIQHIYYLLGVVALIGLVGTWMTHKQVLKGGGHDTIH